jgi:hypothetical protein
VDLFRDSGDPFYEADSLVHLGDSHAAAGDSHRARDAWQAAVTILDEMAHPNAATVRARLSRIGDDKAARDDTSRGNGMLAMPT